jgi:hypothetical protein
MSTKLVFPFLFAVLCAACSDDPKCEGSLCGQQQEVQPASGSGGSESGRPPTEGPEGCYIEADRRCDCDLEEDACMGEGQIWTDGCASCAE